MDKQDSPSEEIVIVGSRYGALADVVKPIYETGTPIREDNIRGLLGFDEVILAPADNDFDNLAVGAYTSELKQIGHVWMCQSPRKPQGLTCSSPLYTLSFAAFTRRLFSSLTFPMQNILEESEK